MTQKDMEAKFAYAESILGALEYDQLKSFFIDVWNRKSDFIVFGTQRCSMLHSIFLPFAPSASLKSNCCITANAFLLYAAEFAKSYVETGSFPTVTLVEDVRFFGSNTDYILHKFEQLIIEETNKYQKLSDWDRHYLHQALSKAVKIYVFAMYMYDREKTKSYGFSYKCNSATKMRSPSNVNEILKKISELIRKSNEANTIFHFSVKVPESVALKTENKEKWITKKWHYLDAKQIVYFPSNVNEKEFYSSVCIHGFEHFNRNGQICLTGFPIWRELKKDDFDLICNIIKSAFDNSSLSNKFKWIRHLLNFKNDNVIPVQAQFVSFIFSVLSVFAFCKDCGMDLNKQYILNNSNAKCIAMNFGRFDDVWADIQELCTNQILLGMLQKQLYTRFDKNSKARFNESSRVFHEDEIQEINKVFENIFYQAKMRKDAYDYEISCNRKYMKTSIRGYDVILLSELLTKVSKEKQINYYATFVCQIALMNGGLTTMNFEFVKATAKIECAFKADELSTFVIPRRLHCFIPALSLVERERVASVSESSELLQKFIEHILNADNHPENKMECEALNCLKTQGNEFVDMLYKCGQRVRFWEFGILSYSDIQEQCQIEKMTHFQFIMQTSKRERHYLNEAKSFLRKNWSQRFG